MGSRALWLAAGMLVALVSTSGGVAVADSSVHIRVDQAGFAPGEEKQAYLMAARALPYRVVDARGRTVLSGTAGRDLGRWNAAYQHVFELDLSALRTPGRYRITSGGASQTVTVAPAKALDGPAGKVLGFFGEQRDRRHKGDRAASVYDWPEFTGPDTDQIKGELKKIGGPVDVAGGWYDAGDYLKFTHILAYADTLLWAARRDGGRNARLSAEADYGLKYLDKMWDGATKTLYIQVGIGAGNAEGTFAGDHDVWRMPAADDSSPRSTCARGPSSAPLPPASRSAPTWPGAPPPRSPWPRR